MYSLSYGIIIIDKIFVEHIKLLTFDHYDLKNNNFIWFNPIY